MKILFKGHEISNKLFSIFTNTAINSSSKCSDYIWQQAKVPTCLLEKEIQDLKSQK